MYIVEISKILFQFIKKRSKTLSPAVFDQVYLVL